MERKEIRQFLENHLHKPSEAMVDCVKVMLDTQILTVLDEIEAAGSVDSAIPGGMGNVTKNCFDEIRNRINQCEGE